MAPTSGLCPPPPPPAPSVRLVSVLLLLLLYRYYTCTNPIPTIPTVYPMSTALVVSTQLR